MNLIYVYWVFMIFVENVEVGYIGVDLM